jgi:FkbM family methyltransferase
MSFISYAQNLEDVILYRSLKHVDIGFYIDIGAQHPVIDSVTKAFYERGWHGLNVEPVAKYFQLLQQDRSRDINLNLVVSNRKGHRTLYEIPDTGLSAVDEKYARISSKGHIFRAHEVACNTLDTICREYDVNTVHFLKIDVEGAEREVLEGFSFDKIRPWIIVIEANEPNSTRDISNTWDTLFLDHSYKSVYYDGLNRFFIAKEHSELEKYFSAPPNVFDDYVLYRQVQIENELLLLRNSQTQHIQLVRVPETTSDLSSIPLQAVYHSLSWKITAPLRFLGKLIIAFIDIFIHIFRPIAKRAFRLILEHNRIRSIAIKFSYRFPKIKTKLLIIAGLNPTPIVQSSTRTVVVTPEKLPESARIIYQKLLDACSGKVPTKEKLPEPREGSR